MRKLLYIFICAALLCGCAAPAAQTAPTETETMPEEILMTTIPETVPETVPEPTAPPDPIRQLLDHMTLEERVGQLFLARHPQTGALEDLQKYHLGGYILFAADFEGRTPEEVRELLAGYQAASEIPILIAVDEEGGTVTRVSCWPAFRESPFLSPRAYFRQGGIEAVLAAEEEKAQLLT
ncbi:MAG: beta-hexosaminidase, partial [Clostridia bacterium]|nr:beta-hexosaminidase [Clostridia bacterium]